MRRVLSLKKILLFIWKSVRIFLLIAGGFLFVRKREKIRSLFKNSNFILAALHGILFSLIALVYRLIEALNWIIQQAR